MGSRPPTIVTALGWIVVALSVVFGTVLRLADPLSSAVIPAEDPYNHMAYVREHLRTGTLDPMNPPGGLYPPGLHSLLAAVWVFTGADLYEIIRFGPVVFGALGVLGVGLLLWRFAGPVAAAVGSLAYAIVPEVVFRTTMMAPTAMDLALLPFLFFVILQLFGGSLRWFAVALPFTAFFVFAHPWLFGILGAAAFVFLAAAVVLPWRTRHPPHPTAFGLALFVALLGGGLGLALTGCGGYCGPGLREVLPAWALAGWFTPVVIAASFLPAILFYFAFRRAQRRGVAGSVQRRSPLLDRLVPGPMRRGVPLWLGIIVSAGIAVAFVAFTAPAVQHGMPEQVELPRMLGLPVLYLGFLGFMLLPLVKGRLAYLGAALVVPTYPMVIYDLLDSQYWPHRSVVFLGLALVILAGVAAEAIVRWSVAAARRLAPALARGRAERAATLPRTLTVVVAVVALVSFTGTVYAQTPDPYPSWYRLYPDCEMDALGEFAARIEEEPRALVVVGDWRTRVVLIALASDPSRVWLDEAFFRVPDHRDDLIYVQSQEYSAIYLVMDRHAMSNYRDVDLSFVEDPEWRHVGAWCAGMGTPEPRLVVHMVEGIRR